jgi:hypothetical protein
LRGEITIFESWFTINGGDGAKIMPDLYFYRDQEEKKDYEAKEKKVIEEPQEPIEEVSLEKSKSYLSVFRKRNTVILAPASNSFSSLKSRLISGPRLKKTKLMKMLRKTKERLLKHRTVKHGNLSFLCWCYVVIIKKYVISLIEYTSFCSTLCSFTQILGDYELQ